MSKSISTYGVTNEIAFFLALLVACCVASKSDRLDTIINLGPTGTVHQFRRNAIGKFGVFTSPPMRQAPVSLFYVIKCAM
ncbi:hypothetical protein V1505DRAFT_363342 [Lipomyces doorenjongii]